MYYLAAYKKVAHIFYIFNPISIKLIKNMPTTIYWLDVNVLKIVGVTAVLY